MELNEVIKPKTDGRIRVYGYDGANEILIALYDREDVNPRYARYEASGIASAVAAKVKKRFFKYTTDELERESDIHVEALIHTLQAIKDRKNNNNPGFNANLQLAQGFLNKEIAGPQNTSTTGIKFSNFRRNVGLIS